MELRQLRYLQAVVEEGNFTRAADRVFVSQSALSQQIQVLEQAVGTTLVDRSKRGVRLTAAGEILYQHALRVFSELEQATVAIQELEGLQRGELRVGVVQTVNDYLMPGLITDFAARFPQVKLMVEELTTEGIEAGLAQGALQVGLSFVPTSDPRLATEALYQERLALIVRHDHPLAGYEAVAAKLLDDLPMVMLSHTFCTRQLWEDNARLASAQPNVVMELNTVSSILSVVEKTGYATVLPELTLAEARSGNLKTVALTDPTPSRTVGLLWHTDRFLCSATRAFITLAQDSTHATQPDIARAAR